jgi:hypothetical protein
VQYQAGGEVSHPLTHVCDHVQHASCWLRDRTCNTRAQAACKPSHPVGSRTVEWLADQTSQTTDDTIHVTTQPLESVTHDLLLAKLTPCHSAATTTNPIAAANPAGATAGAATDHTTACPQHMLLSVSEVFCVHGQHCDAMAEIGRDP